MTAPWVFIWNVKLRGSSRAERKVFLTHYKQLFWFWHNNQFLGIILFLLSGSMDMKMFWITFEFWNTFPLDLNSIGKLVKFREFTQNILQSTFTWNKLMKRTLSKDVVVSVDSYGIPTTLDKLLASVRKSFLLIFSASSRSLQDLSW